MRINIFALLTIAIFLAAPTATAAKCNYAPTEHTAAFREAHVGLKIVDVALVRLPMFALSLGSTVLYIATLPLTIPTGTSIDLAARMVQVPWRFTARRPYGNFSQYEDRRTVEGWPICAPGAYGCPDARGEPVCHRWR